MDEVSEGVSKGTTLFVGLYSARWWIGDIARADLTIRGDCEGSSKSAAEEAGHQVCVRVCMDRSYFWNPLE